MRLRHLILALMIPPLLILLLALKVNLWLLIALLIGWQLIAYALFCSKIAAPLEKIKSAALHLASGHFEDSLEIEGLKEIVELSTALQTLREYLSSLQNTPAEKLYGEYECAELMQYEMLDRVMEHLQAPYLIRKASLPSATSYGLRLIEKQGKLQLQEAEKEGFQGIYDLLTQGTSKTLEVNLHEGTARAQGLSEPLLWSGKDKKLIPLAPLQPDDILILFNTGLVRQLPHPQILKDWLSKILKHFAKDGLDLTIAMLQNELNFFAKKHHRHEDLHILLITLGLA